MGMKRKTLKPTVQPPAATGRKATEGHATEPALAAKEGASPPPVATNDTLRWHDYAGPEREWSFVRWKNKNEHQFSEEFFARDAQGHLVVLKPLLPFLPPGHWTASPFPESNPCRIEPFRLIPPPCRATEAEARVLEGFLNAEESRGGVDFTHKQTSFIRSRERTLRSCRLRDLPESLGTHLWGGSGAQAGGLRPAPGLPRRRIEALASRAPIQEPGA